MKILIVYGKGETKEEAISLAKLRYIEPVKNKYGIHTISETVFGRQKGKEEKIRYNNWDPADIKIRAKELSLKLESN